ncbi:MAG: DMT family transporter [Bacteroidales bacterium]|nr:DMT family transporter [Bacteroidales bacterium]
MKKQSLIRGYYHAGMATLAGSLVYLFSKAALQEVSLAQFGVWWFFFGIIWNLLYSLTPHEIPSYKRIDKKSIRILVFIGFIEIIATTSFYMSINVANNPALPSFVRNMEYVFIAIIGLMLLKEKFNKLEAVGVMLTFAGVFVIGYNQSFSFSSLLQGATGLMLLSASFYAIRTTTAKRIVKSLSPTILALNRASFLMMFALIMLIVRNESIIVSEQAFLIILAGSFLGPFLTSISQYSALVYLEASFTSILQSTTGLFVLLGAWVYFGSLPLWYQVIGGIITIAGVVILTQGKKKAME